MAIGTKKIEDYLPVVRYNEGIYTEKDIQTTGNLIVGGDITITDDLTLDDLTVTGDLAVTGTSSLSGAVNYKRQVTDTGGAYATPIVLTAAQSGRVVLVDDAAGLDFTLPAIAAADIGMHFKFLVTVTVTSNNFRVTAAAGDLLQGGLWTVDFDDVYTAPQAVFLEPDGSDDLVMTMNGSTTGGKRGTVVEFIATTATQWFVTGISVGDGVLATPFS